MPASLGSAGSTLVGFAVVALAVWVVARGFQPPKAIGHDPNPQVLPVADGGADAGAPGASAASAAAAGGDDGGALLLSDLVTAEEARRYDAGTGPGALLADGTPVPPLPASAPRQVRFGVVLVSYRGAQPSAGGGRPATRSKAEAKALAEKLLATAQQDFHVAVEQGDTGSSDDVGQMKPGLLEPAPEYVLFTSAVGAVSGPVDTPRGYWIVKRLE
jgi:hypothetical protein